MSPPLTKRRIALAISGASGAVYGRRLLEELTRREEIETHLLISPSAKKVLLIEEGLNVDLERFDPASLGIPATPNLVYHHYDNVAGAVASAGAGAGTALASVGAAGAGGSLPSVPESAGGVSDAISAGGVGLRYGSSAPDT